MSLWFLVAGWIHCIQRGQRRHPQTSINTHDPFICNSNWPQHLACFGRLWSKPRNFTCVAHWNLSLVYLRGILTSPHVMIAKSQAIQSATDLRRWWFNPLRQSLQTAGPGLLFYLRDGGCLEASDWKAEVPQGEKGGFIPGRSAWFAKAIGPFALEIQWLC